MTSPKHDTIISRKTELEEFGAFFTADSQLF